MVVPVVLDRLDQALCAEAELFLQLLHDLHVDVLKVSCRTEASALRLIQLVPGMVPDLFHANSRVRISVEDLGDEVLRIFREELRHAVVCVKNFLVEIARFLILEGEVATEHGIEDHTTAPQITFQSVVLLACDHLRRCVARAPASSFELGPLFIKIAQAKIYHFETPIIVNEQVFWLQIPVAYSH